MGSMQKPRKATYVAVRGDRAVVSIPNEGRALVQVGAALIFVGLVKIAVENQ
jgi:hypothetical protein